MPGAAAQLKQAWKALLGDYDSSAVAADANGNVVELLKAIHAGMPAGGATKIEQYPNGSFATVPASAWGSYNNGGAGSFPMNGAQALDFHPSGNWLAVVDDASPWFKVYNWTSQTLGASESDPADVPAAAVGTLKFSPDGNWLAVASSTYLYVYAFNSTTGAIGTRYAAATTPGEAVTDMDWGRNSDAIFLYCSGDARVTAYTFDTATGTIGSRVQNTVIGTASANDHVIKCNPQADYLAIISTTSPYLKVYAYSGATLGTASGNPATLPGSQCNAIDWHPSGDYIAVSFDTTSPYFHVYPFNRSTGVLSDKIANPTTAPTSSGEGHVFWSAEGAGLYYYAQTPAYYPFIKEALGARSEGGAATWPATHNYGKAVNRGLGFNTGVIDFVHSYPGQANIYSHKHTMGVVTWTPAITCSEFDVDWDSAGANDLLLSVTADANWTRKAASYFAEQSTPRRVPVRAAKVRAVGDGAKIRFTGYGS